MSDTQIGPQTALTVAGEVSVWELTAKSVTFPIAVDGGDGKSYALGVSLSPYEARELKEALQAERQGYSQDLNGDYTQINRTYREFFPMLDRHFLSIDGLSSADPDKQREWLKTNQQLKALIIKECWGGVRLWFEAADAPSGLLDIDSVLDAPISISTTQKLWNPADKLGVQVQITHRMKRPNQNQYSRASSAIRTKIGKRNSLNTDVNNDVLEILYNEGAVSISGMTVGGVECTEANRDNWIGLVPLWHKTLVVIELYRETRVKN